MCDRIRTSYQNNGELSETAKFQLKPQYKNYARIDDALKKEQEIREQIKKGNLNFKNTEREKLNKKRMTLVVLWAVGIVFLTTIIYFTFECDTVVLPLIISMLPISLVIMYRISVITEECMTLISNHGHNEEILGERKITLMYSELLLNVDLCRFLGIPDDIQFDADELPYYKHSPPNTSTNYGSFTRYIASTSGARYHKVSGCSGAYDPVHMYQLSLNGYSFKYRFYTPCQICGHGDVIAVPEWYTYYRKVRDVTKKYGIKTK